MTLNFEHGEVNRSHWKFYLFCIKPEKYLFFFSRDFPNNSSFRIILQQAPRLWSFQNSSYRYGSYN